MKDIGPNCRGFRKNLKLWNRSLKILAKKPNKSRSQEIIKAKSFLEDKAIEEYLKTQINYRKLFGKKHEDLKPARIVPAIRTESKKRRTATKRSIGRFWNLYL